MVTFERREDGGLRAYSDDVPGFVLSHKDPEAVFRDVTPALECILSAMWGVEVHAEVLPHVGRPASIPPAYVLEQRTACEYVACVS